MTYTWPHDDYTSLVGFYGKPWQKPDLLTHVIPPFQMKFEGALIHGILIHEKCALALNEALQKIWQAYGSQPAIDATGFSNYSGSYNYRNVRGATSLSCHAFGAAIDVNAEKLSLGSTKRLPDPIIQAFKSVGAFYGGDFIHRKDPMHLQFANEG